VIGVIIQLLYDAGFFIQYKYTNNTHIFIIWKCYNGLECKDSWVVSDLFVKQTMSKDLLMESMEPRMKRIDEVIMQRRLIESTLDT
jgi:hypothetical protein